MFLQVFLAGLAVLQIVNSHVIYHENGDIDPVDLHYYCAHVQEKGKDYNKTPIILIHGLTSTFKDWQSVLPVLAVQTNRRVCAVDLRNHGESPCNSQTDIAAMAVDIGHFLDMQHIPKAIIIGHSLGGKVAVHYTLNNPDRVDYLVVEDSRPNNLRKWEFDRASISMKNFLDAIDTVPQGSTVDKAKKIVQKFLNERYTEMGWETIDDNEASGFSIHCINGTCEWITCRILMQKFADDHRSLWTESKGLYKGPTLFIYGTKSSYEVGADKENILKLFPNAELFGVQGAGHDVHERFTREFLNKVIGFIC